MAAVYATYEFYTDEYGGTAVKDSDFTRLATKASRYIDKLTFGRTAALTSHPPEVSQAVCALCDYYVQVGENRTGKSSESIGDYSVTYASRKTETAEVRSLVEMYLPRELLYKGVAYDNQC